eukprot:TRINITY_DN19564_c0_g2_i1.p2 TRINITY_DN19564_c0_g2~~TRINITY_DN19564_c0_g2_i1.p2  ORF type:complete len:252 (-),score=71.27 TRINITY_DN19564_c0_g2_i1:302-1057(-)
MLGFARTAPKAESEPESKKSRAGATSGSPSGAASTLSAKSANKSTEKSAKQHKKAGDTKVNGRLIEVLGSMAMHSAMLHRVHKSVTTETRLLQADSEIISAAKSATQAYSLQAKELKDKPEERALLGPPNVVVWDSILTRCQKAAQANEGKWKKELEALVVYKAKVAEKEKPQDQLEIICRDVKLCRTAKTFDKKTAKLEISVVPSSPAWAAWMAADKMLVEGFKAVRKHGIAPRGSLERELATLTEDLAL